LVCPSPAARHGTLARRLIGADAELYADTERFRVA
jgi:hypothetical protein